VFAMRGVPRPSRHSLCSECPHCRIAQARGLISGREHAPWPPAAMPSQIPLRLNQTLSSAGSIIRIDAPCALPARTLFKSASPSARATECQRGCSADKRSECGSPGTRYRAAAIPTDVPEAVSSHVSAQRRGVYAHESKAAADSEWGAKHRLRPSLPPDVGAESAVLATLSIRGAPYRHPFQLRV
jgi:hypothetical protein